MIHSLLGDSYGCVNHACGAINPPSKVEYNLVVILNSAEPNTSASYAVAGYDNSSHVPCVHGVFGAVHSGSCKILSILPFSKPCVYTCGIDVEMVGIDDRRIATCVLYERMKHMTRLSLSDMWTFTLGFQHTARQQESADRLCGKDGATGIIGTDDEPYKT